MIIFSQPTIEELKRSIAQVTAAIQQYKDEIGEEEFNRKIQEAMEKPILPYKIGRRNDDETT